MSDVITPEQMESLAKTHADSRVWCCGTFHAVDEIVQCSGYCPHCGESLHHDLADLTSSNSVSVDNVRGEDGDTLSISVRGQTIYGVTIEDVTEIRKWLPVGNPFIEWRSHICSDIALDTILNSLSRRGWEIVLPLMPVGDYVRVVARRQNPGADSNK